MSFRITRVYTRTGDAGETALVGGQRVPKTHPRVEAFGDIDELNASLGLVKEHIGPHCSDLTPLIETLQQELFDVGSELATPPGASYPGMWTVQASQVQMLEQLCDRFGEGLPELPSFILPGGSRLAAFLHQARTVARRAERTVLSLHVHSADDAVNPELVKYLNRLSDLLFVLARWALAREGKSTPLWIPAAKRSPS